MSSAASSTACARKGWRPIALLTEIRNAKQRMPLILPPEAVDTWLTGTPDQAKALLVPYPSELMRAHRVSRRVNKPENDNPGADGAG
jgi:putative SOS response-associated peptidase YedK